MKKMYVGVDNTNRIVSVESGMANGSFEFSFPSDFDFFKSSDYKIVDNELVYEPLPQTPLERIAQLKQQLNDTDYVVIKKMESSITGATLSLEDSERYDKIIAERQKWRDEINKLESQKEVSNCGRVARNTKAKK